jgi:hypothetical protein
MQHPRFSECVPKQLVLRTFEDVSRKQHKTKRFKTVHIVAIGPRGRAVNSIKVQSHELWGLAGAATYTARAWLS